MKQIIPILKQIVNFIIAMAFIVTVAWILGQCNAGTGAADPNMIGGF